MHLDILANIDRSCFGKIAEKLMNHYCVVKRDSRDGCNVIYRLAEIEFYLYDSETPEMDIGTYNRDCKCMEWFFHRSGVDIAFETRCRGNELTKFGGILIRGIEIYRRDKHEHWQHVGVVGGSLLSMFEIFNHCIGVPELVNLPSEMKRVREIRVTSRIGIKDKEPQRFVFNDVDWNMETERIAERKDNDGNYRVVREISSKKYIPKPLYDYGLSM
ncbi:MAG: hypothetical protein K2H04_10825 [Bacteroidaceae bacterium]|nr:hypothetical protein [Bacteroidaceae bacterium]MDE6000543.1 hypothetical protein [Bacteroidaceae bacterium]